jgi:hypothetical protein
MTSSVTERMSLALNFLSNRLVATAEVAKKGFYAPAPVHVWARKIERTRVLKGTIAL